jgi:hypothetical protein
MKRRARRAPSADSQAWTPADRTAIQQSRVDVQSSRHQRAVAIEKAFAAARPTELRKP